MNSPYDLLKRRLEQLGIELEVTRRALSLGAQDSITGWYLKTFEESTLHMVIVPEGISHKKMEIGFHAQLTAIGYTGEDLDIGDQILTQDGTYFVVTAANDYLLGNDQIVRKCKLEQSDIGQGEVPMPIWLIETPPVPEGESGSSEEEQTATGNPEGYADLITYAIWVADPFGTDVGTGASNGGSYADRE